MGASTVFVKVVFYWFNRFRLVGLFRVLLGKTVYISFGRFHKESSTQQIAIKLMENSPNRKFV